MYKRLSFSAQSRRFVHWSRVLNKLGMDFIQQTGRPKQNMGRMIGRAFKKGGYIIQADAVRALQNVLKNEDDPKASLELVIQTMTRKLDNGTASSGNIISVDLIMHVVAELTRDVDDITNDSLQVVSAFDTPIVKYDQVNKSFYFQSRDNCKSLFGSPEAKVTMFRDRLELIRQRLERNKDFAAPTLNHASASREKSYVTLSTLDSLVGISGRRNLLGMIIQRDEGQYYLEDLNGSVRMDLSNCKKDLQRPFHRRVRSRCLGNDPRRSVLCRCHGVPTSGRSNENVAKHADAGHHKVNGVLPTRRNRNVKDGAGGRGCPVRCFLRRALGQPDGHAKAEGNFPRL